MEYDDVARAIREVQGTLEALATRLPESEFKTMAGGAVEKIKSALAAIYDHDQEHHGG